jgi:hypothetical protein
MTNQLSMRPLLCLMLVAGVILAGETGDVLAGGMKVGEVVTRVGTGVGQRLGMAVKLAEKLVSAISAGGVRTTKLVSADEPAVMAWLGEAVGVRLGHLRVSMPPPAM